jgi:hypothetical protein
MPVVSLPAPYGGQNNKDGALTLAPQFATSLTNWIPGPGYLDARGPVTAYSSNNVSDYITSIWGGSTGGVFTTYGGSIYEVDTTIGAALATGLTGSLWHGNAFQSNIILCSGQDAPQIYNGTTVVPADFTGSPMSLTASALAGSLTFKGRAYYWEAASRRFWYAAAGAFQGALSSFDLSTFTRADGNVVSICPLTFDGGQGPDDLIAFLFSSGEVLVYQGDDPGNTNSWQQVGAFRIGKMRGGACWAIVGAATLVATDLGVVDLARALSTGALDDSAVVGQQFGGSNFVFPTIPDASDFRMVLDQSQRILWLLISEAAEYVNGDNVVGFYGMDLESRAWFRVDGVTTSGGRRVTAIGAINGDVYLGASTAGTATGRILNGITRAETLNAVDDYFTESPIGNGTVIYTASQTLPLDSANRNKMVQGVAYHMQRTNSAVTPTLTYEVDSESSTTATAQNYLPNPQTRAFNSAAAYGTQILLTTTLTSKSGVRWLGTDLLVRPGREV